MFIRFIQFLHRILGTLLSILFLIWFLSGFVMIYHSFPKVQETEKWKKKEAIPQIDLPDMEEIAQWIPADETIYSLVIENLHGQTLFRIGTNKEKYIFPADGCSTVLPVTGEMIRQTASRWCPAPVRQIDTLYHVDQWIPFSRLQTEFPIYKFHYEDPLAHQLYLSSRTGEVLQFTHKKSRFWAWTGAIPHWVYFTTLRQNAPLWSETVIWLSGVGSILCMAGLMMGFRHLYQHRKGKRYEFTPYRKPLWKWHHLTGMLFGLFVFTFVFSGMMSLARLPDWLVKVHQPEIERTVRKPPAIQPENYTMDYRILLKEYGGQLKTIEWSCFGTIPYYKVIVDDQQLFFHATGTRLRKLALQEKDILSYVKSIHPEQTEMQLMTGYDHYYLSLNRPLPLPVYKIQISDPDQSIYYINPASGAVRYLHKKQKLQHWTYQAMHSFKLKFLAGHPILWNLLMWTAMIGGTLVSATGVGLGVRYLRRIYKKRTKRVRNI